MKLSNDELALLQDVDAVAATLTAEDISDLAMRMLSDQHCAPDASSALDFKLAAMTGMRTAQQRRFAGADWDDEYKLLTTAPIFFMRREPAELIATAAASYPLTDHPIQAVPHALMIFEHPVLSVRAADGSEHCATASGVLWGPVRYGDQDSTRVVLFSWMGPHVVQLQAFSWPSPHSRRGEDNTPMRWICSAATFIEQQITVPVYAVPTRHARKRAIAANIASDIRVVILRRLSRVPGSAALSDSRDYSCQWLVGGHWRNQWYAKASVHAPKWIAPYVKGPEGKPFKAPTATVFSVAR